ncbi:hypothetical protein [Meiothermus ruber]|jgi:hypothetical protein|uniref:Uncharacterized protein n=1 Tax=Meiothermus ruber (strain ATCC 35948 / DSM 1279 / VKM B-1258 / 21) TaxID=504728 RepID=D3PM84_MEIRD|nr:hypothetical protein [Meiothermus ruber]ADD29190.1 hypothetical protein Mrub_2439 [Meiothermus ruber DSM 1279]AGK05359.1 hypothetical protein K649_10335 [Meiothermus ruber DSM 1279]MCL6531189.1 hypothetical protein [Meiothermus ruber]GAO76112.1 putative uncharacterized protein [Meiothermus ruber H328]
MKVHWQEVAMVAAVAGIFTLVAQIPQVGFWKALWLGLPVALLAGGAYGLLMPWIIRWAAKGARPKETPPDDETRV